MGKLLAFIYGILTYLVFLVAVLYAIGFMGNMVVPKSIDSGAMSGFSESLIVNLVLLGLFAVQHTVMARPAFKKWWTQFVPVHMERSTYVLVSSLLLFLIFWQWRPMTGVIWSVQQPAVSALLWGLFWLGWATVLFSTYMINHFDLFGLRQVWLHLRDKEYRHVEFQTAGLYKHLRHPIMLGFIIAFWATPQMTAGHLLFAAATTAYILIGVQFEEHDLVHYLGKDYEDYRRRVPMLVPFTKKRGAGSVDD